MSDTVQPKDEDQSSIYDDCCTDFVEGSEAAAETRNLLPPIEVAAGPSRFTRPSRNDARRFPGQVVAEQVELLECWAAMNESLARKEMARYWVLKVPALLSSLSVGVLQAAGLGNLAAALGVLAGICIGIDAIRPGGFLYSMHRRAANEIRRLQHDVLTLWRAAELRSADQPASLRSAALEILDRIQSERTRIDKMATDAEAYLSRSELTREPTGQSADGDVKQKKNRK